eukprot:1603489-Rhodomonas_salina.7
MAAMTAASTDRSRRGKRVDKSEAGRVLSLITRAHRQHFVDGPSASAHDAQMLRAEATLHQLHERNLCSRTNRAESQISCSALQSAACGDADDFS